MGSAASAIAKISTATISSQDSLIFIILVPAQPAFVEQRDAVTRQHDDASHQ